MIVKIQRPISTNEPISQLLIYDRSRRFRAIMPMTEELVSLFEQHGLLPERAKLFAQITVVRSGEMTIDKVLVGEDLGW